MTRPSLSSPSTSQSPSKSKAQAAPVGYAGVIEQTVLEGFITNSRDVHLQFAVGRSPGSLEVTMTDDSSGTTRTIEGYYSHDHVIGLIRFYFASMQRIDGPAKTDLSHALENVGPDALRHSTERYIKSVLTASEMVAVKRYQTLTTESNGSTRSELLADALKGNVALADAVHSVLLLASGHAR